MKIFIGMPVYNGTVNCHTVENLLDLILKSKSRGDQAWIYFPQSPFLSLSRNLIISEALKKQADWVLMWDSDIQVSTSDFVYKLIDTAYKNEATFIGLAVRKKTELGDIVYACAMKVDGEYKCLDKNNIGKTPKEVDVMGAGVSLINCHWIRNNLEQPYFSFRDIIYDGIPSIIPEDWVFSERIKENGGKIMVEPTIETIHYGTFGWHYKINGT